ncbi:hypothetical protein GJ744_004656 [Endocarpon pusillum]|uniref:CCHC-type domain-containing protein n=1 Tax=Endocarpon pusillum TaxID=364733 RepID=A0A8H7E6U3_9EURO|nr:hypothetical protein GJ744_004656 [Endocarpon pusillum]
MTYEEFVQECLRQDNLLRATASRQMTKLWRSAPTPANPVNAKTTMSTPVLDIRPAAIPNSVLYDLMDLDRSRRPATSNREAERERRRVHRLCYYCAQPGHRANDCPEKPSSALRSNVRATSPSSVSPADSAFVAQPATLTLTSTQTDAPSQLKDKSLD